MAARPASDSHAAAHAAVQPRILPAAPVKRVAHSGAHVLAEANQTERKKIVQLEQ